jgi:hypothetical protein
MSGQKSYRTLSHDAYVGARLGEKDPLLEALRRAHPERAPRPKPSPRVVDIPQEASHSRDIGAHPLRTPTRSVSHQPKVLRAMGSSDVCPPKTPQVPSLQTGNTTLQNNPISPSYRKRVIATVCLDYKITFEELVKPGRLHNEPRTVITYLLRSERNMSYLQIGKLLCRNHTSIIYAFRTISLRLNPENPEYDAKFAARVECIRAQLREASPELIGESSEET